MARHSKTRTHTPKRILILQAVTGIITILLFALIAQITWIFGANAIDLTYRQEKLAGGTKTEQVVNQISDPIAKPHYDNPPLVDAPPLGDAIGWMYIPRLGATWRHLIQEGTTQTILDNVGIGHYEHTVMAGGVGNAAYAGHRMPADLGYADRLREGDAIVIQSGGYWYVYRVQRQWVTSPDDVGVLSQDSGSRRLITLTTCDPMVAARTAPRRLIVRGVFDYWARVKDGVPREIAVSRDSVRAVRVRLADSLRRVSERMPITPLLAAGYFLCWLVINVLTGVCTRFRHKVWVMSCNPVTWLWRAQFGGTVLRAVNMLLLCSAILCACWAWVCPWIAQTIPWLSGFGTATV